MAFLSDKPAIWNEKQNAGTLDLKIVSLGQRISLKYQAVLTY